jgi:ferredoxin
VRVRVDDMLCAGFGSCVATLPDVFSLDENGFSHVVGDGDVPPGSEELGQLAIDSCPARAISLVEDAPARPL